ncbi:MAG: ATP-binding protein [Bacteroidales bacterium]|jgi:hypothetical protein
MNPNIVSADPAKSFFVSMLIKDITLRDAIGDLVDNAVDAIKEKVANIDNLSGFEVEIKLGKSYFSITDNGFGMEAKIARETAFNFGKSENHKLIDNSIGQFGIGMKRAFFKLGSNIKVKSISRTSKFDLTINVGEWLKEPKIWEFKFDQDSLKENEINDLKETGFKIHISNLSFDSQVSFDDNNFIDKLIKEISLEHMININKGLTIKINGFKLKPTQITLVNDDNIKPTYWEKTSNGQTVKILAGISTYDSDEGGWYIFCNDRLIISKNKTAETVWTGSKGDGVPLWHAQYFRFRGYVFFEAKDSSDLPWNTTKNGMDLDSPYYKEVRGQMINMTRQVMELLDKLKEEKTKDNPQENQTLNKLVESSLKTATPVASVLKHTEVLNNKFHFPIKLFNPPRKSKSVRITYQVSKEKYEAVEQHLNAPSSKEVGLETFNYYFNNQL